MSLIFNPVNTSGKVSTVGDVHDAVETAPNTIEIESDIIVLQAEIASLLSSGGLSYKGTWNASTNTPTITSGVGSKGNYYVVSADGSTNIDGITDWVIADWIIFNGTVWEKADHTDAVTSVSGKQGAVTLDNADVGLDQVVNLKHNYNALSDPTANDDTTQGYQVGSRWKDTTNHHEFVCTDATTASAIWTRTTAKDTSHITEDPSNLYYTEARVSANTDVTANTAKVSADGSIATHSDVSLAGPALGNILYMDGVGQWTNLFTGSNGQTLQLSGGAPSWATVGLNNMSDVTLTTPTTGGILYKSAGDWLDSEEVLITPGTGVVCANALDSQGGKIGVRSWVMKNPSADGLLIIDNLDPATNFYVEGTAGVPESASYIRMQGADLFIEAFDAGEAGNTVTGQTTVFETSKLVAKVGTTNGLEITKNLSISDALTGGVLCLASNTSPSSVVTTGTDLTSFVQLGDNMQLTTEESVSGNRFLNISNAIYKDAGNWKALEANIKSGLLQVGNTKLDWLVDTSTAHIIGDTVTLTSQMNVDENGNMVLGGDLTTSGTTLTAKLAGKSNTGHTHTSLNITDFPAAVAAQVTTKANKANETHTGTTTINQIDCADITATGTNPNLFIGPNGSGLNLLTLKAGASVGVVLSTSNLSVSHPIGQYTANTPLVLEGNGTADYVEINGSFLYTDNVNSSTSALSYATRDLGAGIQIKERFFIGHNTSNNTMQILSGAYITPGNVFKNTFTGSANWGQHAIFSSATTGNALFDWRRGTNGTVDNTTSSTTQLMVLQTDGDLAILGTYTPFTGVHEANHNITPSSYIDGLILNTTGQAELDSVYSSKPTVELTTTAECSSVYGVTYWKTVDQDKELRVVSVGEGGMWVTDYNGELSNGDYVTSSVIEGYGQLQNSDIMMNYTVAKITQNIDWANVTDTIEYGGVDYKKVFVACTFHCG